MQAAQYSASEAARVGAGEFATDEPGEAINGVRENGKTGHEKGGGGGGGGGGGKAKLGCFKDGVCKLWNTVKWALLIIFLFALVAGISLFVAQKNKKYTPYQLERVKSLLQFASKSAAEAERIGEDDSLQALLHADYAVSYVGAAKHLVDRKTIETLLGVANLSDLERYLEQLQTRFLVPVALAVEAHAAPEVSEKTPPLPPPLPLPKPSPPSVSAPPSAPLKSPPASLSSLLV